MKKIIKWLDAHLEETILAILLVVIACVSLAQVIIRKLPWIPALTWAEEFCRFCWIWSVFISLPYTIRMGNMLRVTVVLELLPDKARRILDCIVDIINMLCMGLLAYFSVEVVSDIHASHELSPAMLWPMWFIYSVILIGFTLGTVRSLEMFVLHIKAMKTGVSAEISGSTEEAAALEAAMAEMPAEGGEN